MTEHQRQLRYNAASFLLLFLVSLYRQLSLRYWPDDPYRTYVLYACYIFLIGIWALSIPARVTQKNMRIFMLLQAAIIFFGATIRFLQDTFWMFNIHLTRISGLWLSASLLPLLLCGFYAALGIGQADSYRIPRKWYWLIIPALLMAALNVTDEYHHLMFFLIEDELRPNLEFYPNVGTFFMGGLIFLLMTVRILYIYRQNRILSSKRVQQVLSPLFEPILMIFFSFTYFAGTLGWVPSLKGAEVLELYAKLYYGEVLTWEYFYMGLIPTNMDYPEIFQHATVSMQIIRDDGGRLLSKSAEAVSDKTMDTLEKKGHVSISNSKELYIYRFPGGRLLWSKDLSQLKRALEALDRSAEMLSEEGAFLREELKARKQETALYAKRQIYDELTKEVSRQLQMLNELTKNCTAAAEGDRQLRQLYLLGTYVKRRCNLRLIQRETGRILSDDLYLSLKDIISALNILGIRAKLNWRQARELSADFSIFLFDAFEQIIESERFDLDAICVEAADAQLSFDVEKENASLPDEVIFAAKRADFDVHSGVKPTGYRIVLTQGGEGCV